MAAGTRGIVTNGSPLWYVARGTGAVSLILITFSIVLGIANQVRWTMPMLPRFSIQRIHRNVSLLVLAVLGVHIATTVIDHFAPITWLDAVIPFASPYRRLWLGLGAVAFDVLIAIVVTSLVRARLGYRAWRAVHWLAYAAWPVAILHGLGTGTDTRLGWMLFLTVVCIGAVVLTVWWRVAVGWPANLGARVLGIAASVLGPIAIMAFLFAGPLRPGWSRAAGTPQTLLAASRTSAATPTPSASVFPSPPFSGSFAGSIEQSQPGSNGDVQVRITGTLSGDATGVLDVVLEGTPLSDGEGIQMVASRASMGPASDPRLYRGSVVQLDGADIVLRMTSRSQPAIDLQMRVNIDQQTGRVTAVVQGVAAGA
ncbi:MAG: ferric reductase-like transmembrane domain-containing protein [Actinomycetota bacterium]